jgi:hypothetical protein
MRSPGVRRSPRSRTPLPATSGTRDLATRLFGRHPQHVLALLRAAWPAAVGHELARRTEVLGVEGRTLRVRVPDASWRKVLHRMRRDILSRLYRSVGDLAPAALGFQEGPITIADSPLRPPIHIAGPVPELPASVREAAAIIADDDLRASFSATAARYLKRQSCVKP